VERSFPEACEDDKEDRRYSALYPRYHASVPTPLLTGPPLTVKIRASPTFPSSRRVLRLPPWPSSKSSTSSQTPSCQADWPAASTYETNGQMAGNLRRGQMGRWRARWVRSSYICWENRNRERCSDRVEASAACTVLPHIYRVSYFVASQMYTLSLRETTHTG
jgi:hypothetical protein